MGNTWQKQEILDGLAQAGGHHVTVEDIMAHLQSNKKKIGKATVYRFLKELEREGHIQRFCNHDGQSACYRYVEHGDCNHYHLRCDACGQLYHLELTHSVQVVTQAMEQYGFAIDEQRTVFYGCCKACRGEGVAPVI